LDYNRLVKNTLLYDGLTDAFSRDAFNARIEAEFGRSNRTGRPFSLLLLDLDYFKSINDAFGHQRGDLALKEFVRRIKSFVRASDDVFRYGGDEFVILLPETNRERAKKLADRILECVADEPMRGNPPISLTASIGVASFPEDAGSYEQLFAVADRRHYTSKALGRGRVTAQDVEIARGSTLFAPDRLIERDQPEVRLRDFFAQLSTHQRGFLRVTGARGVGQSRFITEAAKLAKLRGFAVLHLRGKNCLRTRSYGALTEALQGWLNPPEFLDPETLIAFIETAIHNKELNGLVVLADHHHHLNQFTLDALHALLRTDRVQPVGFITSDDGSGVRNFSELQFDYQVQVELHPLSSRGVKIWLRHCLEWEPSDRLVQWTFQTTEGLPDRIYKTLDWLTAHKRLKKTGRGWQFSAPASSSFSPDSVFHPSPLPENLPHPLPDLIGRGREIELLKNMVRAQRLVTLVGVGGSGKTHLALQAMCELQDEFPDGTFWLACESSVSSAQFLASIASAARLRLPAAEDPLPGLVEELADKRILFLLDNFESALDSAGIVETLVKQTRGLTMLVTSQIELGLAGETAFALQGLPIPSGGSACMQACPSVQLFLHHARRASPNFVENLECVARICQLTEGMPLGIEVAAAWASTLTCDEIAERIQGNIGLQSPGHPGRSLTLQAVFDSLWQLFSESEQRVLMALCIFRGGFCRTAAQEIAEASPFFLDALSGRAFIQRMGKGRYRLHHSLRRYLLEKLSADPVMESYVAARHGD